MESRPGISREHDRALVGPTTVNRELATLRRVSHLAHEWRAIQGVPRFHLLPGERNREFVLSRQQESVYLAACPQPLQDIAVVMLESGLRIGEVLHLEWPDVVFEPVNGARFGFIRIREGKTKNAHRIIPLTDRANAMLEERWKMRTCGFVFANRNQQLYFGTSINHPHQKACVPNIDGKGKRLFSQDFVLHSLRHTMLTRLGESGVDAFTIMRIAGHSSITVSQRYVHPTPEAVERAFERFRFSGERAEVEAKKQAVATIFATSNKELAASH